jgi:hypothetical protein
MEEPKEIASIRERRAKQYGHSFTGTRGTEEAMADIDTLLAAYTAAREEIDDLRANNIRELLREIKSRLVAEDAEQFEELLLSATRGWVAEVENP